MDLLTTGHELFFRRKRGSCVVEGVPLVVDTCWPAKKARVGGSRKKRSVQNLLSSLDLAVVQVQPEDVHVSPEDVQVLAEDVHVVVQTKVAEDVQVQAKAILEDVDMQIEVVLEDGPAVDRAVRRPTESDAKKTRSMSDLLALESKASKAKPKKKKSIGKK